MIRVFDASAIVAALVDDGADGGWAETMLAAGPLAAPHLMPVEAASVLRRAAAAGQLSADTAGLAHADLLALTVELFPYEPLGARIWELRAAVTAHDAWYIALAESLHAPLVTLDTRLSRASGPSCTFELPPSVPAPRSDA